MPFVASPVDTAKTDILLDVKVSGAMIKELREALKQSLSEFGWTLKRAIDPRASQPYSRQYISRLEKGQDRVTPELVSAFYQIAGVIDEVPAGVGGAVSVKVLAQAGQVPEGSLIPRTAKVVRCARPGCSVIFVKINSQQKYHDIECKRAHDRDKRKVRSK